MPFDLHRHDEYSTFDGFGKALELAKLAKDYGYTALGLSNHGNTNGLVQHYYGCKEAEIKPIMGVEGYFQPVINKEKPRFHLCLFAKNLQGYINMNKLQYIGEQQKYYNPIYCFKDLEEHSEGLICTSACIAGYVSQCIAKGNNKLAEKAMLKFKQIFGDDYYIEIQPYKIDDEGTQENVNNELIKLANKLGIKCILTSDSHYGSIDDFDTYIKMHAIANHGYDIERTYGERYMPKLNDLEQRFIKMHGNAKLAKEMCRNLDEIQSKVEDEILEKLPLDLPQFIEGKDSYEVLVEKVKAGLKQKGKFKKEYINRCKEELKVIKFHGFADYFLIVADYVNWAKSQGITVGPGRGSVCNCQVAYALNITTVDSLRFGLDFRRFLREDKKKLPDVDLDFETSRRAEVIEYLVNKYDGHAAQICSYGLYKVDNLINDLVKVCGVEEKSEIERIKKFLNTYVIDGRFDYNSIINKQETKSINRQYDNILKHFNKLFKKVRYIGTHAAGVAITGGKLINYSALRLSKDKIFTSYDLADLEKVNVIKFDILGLKTMESLGELRRLTNNDELNDDLLDDPEINAAFGRGDTDGIFQFEKSAAREILRSIHSDCFEDVVAASSMNRPGPLSLNMPQTYAENKFNVEEAKHSKYYQYTKDTYGTVVYQEQLQHICVYLANMSWGDSDRVMKILKGSSITEATLKKVERDKAELIEKFVTGAMQNGFTSKEAHELFENLLVYSFNKGHGVGYTKISVEEMYYKLHYPTEYWYTKIKYAEKDADIFKFKLSAIKQGIVLFLPHVNYSDDFTLRVVDGERVIQEGLIGIKGVGAKAAKFIAEEKQRNGVYKSYDDFVERVKCKGSPVNKGVIEKLLEQGALEFNKKIYIKRTIKYNSAMLAR